MFFPIQWFAWITLINAHTHTFMQLNKYRMCAPHLILEGEREMPKAKYSANVLHQVIFKFIRSAQIFFIFFSFERAHAAYTWHINSSLPVFFSQIRSSILNWKLHQTSSQHSHCNTRQLFAKCKSMLGRGEPSTLIAKRKSFAQLTALMIPSSAVHPRRMPGALAQMCFQFDRYIQMDLIYEIHVCSS